MPHPTPGRRIAGALLVLCFAAVTLAVVRRHHGNDLMILFYPKWVAVLVAVGGLSGVAVLVRRSRVAAAVAGVVAVQLAGLAVVAHEHARPAGGMGGAFPADVAMIERQAVVIAVAATVAAIVALLALLPRTGPPAGGWQKVLGTGSGVVVVALVPLAIGATSAEMRDVTSLGAMALCYGIPWGVGLIAAGWLPRDQAVAAAVTVAGSASLALLGPQLPDLVQGRPEPAFTAALALALAMLAALATTRPASSTAERAV